MNKLSSLVRSSPLLLVLHDEDELGVGHLAVLVHVKLVDHGLGLLHLVAHLVTDHLDHLVWGQKPVLLTSQTRKHFDTFSDVAAFVCVNLGELLPDGLKINFDIKKAGL